MQWRDENLSYNCFIHSHWNDYKSNNNEDDLTQWFFADPSVNGKRGVSPVRTDSAQRFLETSLLSCFSWNGLKLLFVVILISSWVLWLVRGISRGVGTKPANVASQCISTFSRGAGGRSTRALASGPVCRGTLKRGKGVAELYIGNGRYCVAG